MYNYFYSTMVYYLTKALKMAHKFQNATEQILCKYRRQDCRFDAMRSIKQQLVGLKLSFIDRAMRAGVIVFTKFSP